MALVQCPECHKEYSDQAKSCIHCGAKTLKQKNKTSTGKLLWAFLFLCVAIGMVQNAITPPEDPQVIADREAFSKAATACRMVFEKQAHDPASVDWIREERKGMFRFNKDKSIDKAKIIISEGVRAKNRFGGLIKSTVTCNVINQQGNWNVVDMKVNG